MEYIYLFKYDIGGLPIKVGSTRCPHKRLRSYQTSFPFEVRFMKIYNISSPYTCYEVDDMIQQEFEFYNWNYLNQGNGGIEWYDSQQLTEEKLENFFMKNNINFREEQLEEIEYKESEYIDEQNYKKPRELGLRLQPEIRPHDYQLDVLENLDGLRENKKGKILWSCGLGKTILSLFICYRLRLKKILVGVPSLYILEQFRESVRRIFGIEALCLYGDGDNIDYIRSKILLKDVYIVISTYHSVHKLLNYEFDMKIGDEAHHLVSNKKDELRTFEKFHSISSEYTLFMTSTERVFEDNIEDVYSMNNEDDFGVLIDKKSIKWAIDHKKITDYRIICIENDYNEISYYESEYELELVVSAYCALKCLRDNISKHLLIYTNSCSSSDYIRDIINRMNEEIFQIDIYNNSLHSRCGLDINDEINNFKEMELGIITSVYIFGEGFDIPVLDSVLIAERMDSDIRIVQSCLRPNRLDKSNPEKIANIIIPKNINYIDDKLKMVINKLSQEDDMIEQKIELLRLKEDINKDEIKEREELILEMDYEGLTNLKLALYRSNVFSRGLTLQHEFELYKSIIQEKRYRTIREYKDNEELKTPDIYFCGVWTSWYDLLGIDTMIWIQDKNEWKEFCNSNNITNLNYYCKIDEFEVLPPEPEYFYIGFTNLNNELKNIKKSRYIK